MIFTLSCSLHCYFSNVIDFSLSLSLSLVVDCLYIRLFADHDFLLPFLSPLTCWQQLNFIYLPSVFTFSRIQRRTRGEEKKTLLDKHARKWCRRAASSPSSPSMFIWSFNLMQWKDIRKNMWLIDFRMYEDTTCGLMCIYISRLPQTNIEWRLELRRLNGWYTRASWFSFTLSKSNAFVRKSTATFSTCSFCFFIGRDDKCISIFFFHFLIGSMIITINVCVDRANRMKHFRSKRILAPCLALSLSSSTSCRFSIALQLALFPE